MKSLNIDDLLKKDLRNQIYRVGIELEGAWEKLPSGVSLIRDGSITITANLPMPANIDRTDAAAVTAWSKKNPKLFVGELPSEPMEVAKVRPWMAKFYPHKVNDSCGMHVHMSFHTALHYMRLMTPHYPATIKQYIAKWAEEEKLPKNHAIWPRLANQSRYCQDKFEADLQVRTTGKDYDQNRPGHRYTVINYCYNHHNTLECRLLPMMDTPEQGTRAVEQVMKITNAFLRAYKEREEKVTGNLTMDGDKYVEVKKVFV